MPENREISDFTGIPVEQVIQIEEKPALTV